MEHSEYGPIPQTNKQKKTSQEALLHTEDQIIEKIEQKQFSLGHFCR